MSKKLYVVANWKMYKTARQAADYIENLIPEIEGLDVQVYLAVPFTSIAPAVQCAKQTAIVIGAQNMNDAREGAFTGEIASLMLKEAGASFVLLGHSERRTLFKEDDAMIHKKVLRALQDDIQPLLCIGETQEEHLADRGEIVLKEQIEGGIGAIPKEEASRLMIAYEPVWAIGTGTPPSPDEIQKRHAFCRARLAKAFGKKIASSIPILYGGSVKPENAAEIVRQKDVDGVLVGGASLDVKTAAQIIRNIGEQGVPKKRKTQSKKEKEE